MIDAQRKYGGVYFFRFGLKEVFMSKFDVGCNYWGSKWGTLMWRNWDKDSVENDLRVLSAHDIRFLRVFPNWEDFQPLHIH